MSAQLNSGIPVRDLIELKAGASIAIKCNYLAGLRSIISELLIRIPIFYKSIL